MGGGSPPGMWAFGGLQGTHVGGSFARRHGSYMKAPRYARAACAISRSPVGRRAKLRVDLPENRHDL